MRNKQPYNSEIPKSTITASAAVSSSSKLDSNELKSNSPHNKCALDTVNDTTVTAASGTIDLTDSPSECDDDIEDDTWVMIEGKKLQYMDKEVILKKKWLWSTHLTVVQLLSKKRCPNINGLLDTSLFVHKDQEILPGSVQILHVNGNHWITITTLMNFIDSHCDVVLYDSSYACQPSN